MKSILFFGVFIILAFNLHAQEKILFSFEEEEIKKVLEATKGVLTPGKTENDPQKITINKITWELHKDIKTHGNTSLGITTAFKFDTIKTIGNAPEHLYRDLSVFTTGSGFKTFGFFNKIIDENWADYDLLRFDVYTQTKDNWAQIFLEDENISPGIAQYFDLSPDQWQTCEIDLKELNSIRGLNLSKIVALNIVSFVKQAHSSKIINPFRIDNIRLAKTGTKTTTPIIKGRNKIEAIPFDFPISKPQKELSLQYKPDHNKLDQLEVFTIETNADYAVMPVGWVTSYDNNRILVGFCNAAVSSSVFIKQSLDRGKTWSGLNGQAETKMIIPYNDHQCGTSSTIGQNKDVIVTTNLGCFGSYNQYVRLFTRHIEHQENGWVLREKESFVDSDLRHCNSNQTMFRGKDGRIWLAYGYVGREATRSLALRYSDDNGLTYHTTLKNSNGLIPESKDEKREFCGYGSYTFDEPEIVPYKNGVLIIWVNAKRGYNYKTFENGIWSDLKTIKIPPKKETFNSMRPPIQVVAKENGEVFLSSTQFSGLMHFKDEVWSHIGINLTPGSKLALVGGKKIIAFTINTIESSAYVKKEKNAKINFWLLNDDLTFQEPKEIISENFPFSIQSANAYNARTSFVVDRYSPPNLATIAYTCFEQKWVKVVRIPISE